MKTLFLLGLAITFTLSAAQAQQTGLTCRQNLTIIHTAVNAGEFERALDPWMEVWNTCPEESINLYVFGSQIFQHFHAQETDAARRQEYVDKVMMLYERSMELFPAQRPRGIGLIDKAFTYASMRGEEANQANVRQWLGEAIDIMGSEIPITHAHAYWNYAAASLFLFQREELNAEEYIADYFKIIDLLEQAIAAQEDPELAAHLQILIDGTTGLFISSGAGDCETMVNFYAPQVAANSDNLEFLNEVLGILTQLRCRDTDLFFTVSAYIHAIAPTANSAVGMAQRARRDGDDAAAMRYFRQAAELSDDNSFAADMMMQVSSILMSQRNWAAARTAAQEALRLNPANGAPHIFIAQMYATTANTIFTGADANRTGLVFGAAIDQLERARSVDPSSAAEANRLINQYTAHLIDAETAFMMGIRAGERVHIPGWINVYTTVRLR